MWLFACENKRKSTDIKTYSFNIKKYSNLWKRINILYFKMVANTWELSFKNSFILIDSCSYTERANSLLPIFSQ